MQRDQRQRQKPANPPVKNDPLQSEFAGSRNTERLVGNRSAPHSGAETADATGTATARAAGPREDGKPTDDNSPAKTATGSAADWRDDDKAVPAGPGWVFTVADGKGWNQDACLCDLETERANRGRDVQPDRSKTAHVDQDRPKNGRDGTSRFHRH